MELVVLLVGVVAAIAGIAVGSVYGVKWLVSRPSGPLLVDTGGADPLADLDVAIRDPAVRRGMHDGRLVEVATWRVQDQLLSQLSVRPGRLVDGAFLRAQNVAPEVYAGTPHATGDGRFDQAVRVASGDPADMAALLDADTRDVLRSAVDDGVVVLSGEVKYKAPRRVADADDLRRDAERLLRVAGLLAPERVTPDRLVDRVDDRAAPRLARRAIRALRAGGHPGPLPGAARYRDDPDARVALDACLLAHLDPGDAARRVATDRSLPLADRGAAVPHARLTDADLDLLLDASSPVALPALDAIVAGERRALIPRLAGLLIRGGPHHAGAARALVAIGQPDPELTKRLVAGLHAADRPVRSRVAQVLGAIGTLDAVPALRARADDLLEAPAVRKDAQAALHALQRDVPEGMRGALQVAGGGGELSIDPADG